MLLTITYTQSPATDLGYLLHKNPSRPQTFDLNYGKAHVFYPEADEKRCTAVLMLDMDPIELARGKRGSNGEGGLFDYVNDRPYVSSSFLSVAMSKVFGSAIAGKSKERPELAEKKLPLQAKIVMLACKGDGNIIPRLFEPLGYKVEIQGVQLDEKFPEWGKSRYYNVLLEGEVRLCDLLRHMYVLIPVLDSEKHYWVGKDEIEKLIRHGESWLFAHPERAFITGRYLNRRKNLVDKVFEKFLEEQPSIESEEEQEINDKEEAINENTNENIVKNEQEEKVEKKLNLNQQRLGAILEIIKSIDAKKIIDIGCGEGKLISLLIKEKNLEKITGVDVSHSVLERAVGRLKLDRLPELIRKKIELFQGSLIYKDKRFSGYDIATVIEVIEHLDANRLNAFEKVLFRFAQPKTVIVSTPNREYNQNYKNLADGKLRHRDHRFEWTRDEFENWAKDVASNYGYTVKFIQVGEVDLEYGSPTQMGVFTL